jgi:glycosyltransferase involved in cell wall biosynthesis
MRIALIGTRGVPARYGGFETCVEQVGLRLVKAGHEVVVYCRRGAGDDDEPELAEFEGMELVHLPALRKKSLETLSHTALSVWHLMRHPVDAVIVFNSANAPFLPLIRARGIPVATHVDGLEWKRSKWQGAGRRYYRMAESLAVRWSDALIADAQGIADYYDWEFGADTELIAYGAPIVSSGVSDKLNEAGVTRRGYHLVVARFEPENHVDVIVQGYCRSSAELPLVIVGSASYAAEYAEGIDQAAGADRRIRLLGAVFDQGLLDQLYAHALTYIHGHSVGGTNPSLLRAMGGGTAVLGWDVNFNREVAGTAGLYFRRAEQLARQIEEAERSRPGFARLGELMQERARTHYDWDAVTQAYEALCFKLSGGYSTRGFSDGWHRYGARTRSAAPDA